ncbi:MAG: hypothetical protein ACUVRM_01870 [Bacillota bacterium]
MRFGRSLLFRQSLIFAAVFFLAGLIMSRGAFGRTALMTVVATAVYAGLMAAITAFVRRRSGRA